MTNSITPSLPLKTDTDDSDYLSIKTINSLVRQNLKNLILTNPGERMMDPAFGVGIKRFLFENRTNTTTNTIKNLITGQAKKYMPFIDINSVQFTTSDDNLNYLGINIYYTIIPTKLSDSLSLELQV